MSWAEGAMLGFDLETTGVDPNLAIPVSFALCEMNAGHLVNTVTALVNPGVDIPLAAVAIHGITSDKARSEGIDLAAAVAVLFDAVLGAGRDNVPIVGMNIAYDLTILDRLGREHLGCGLGERGWAGPALDALVLDRHVDRFRKGRRRLGDLCSHYDVALVDAHEAGSDAGAACQVVLAIANRSPAIAEMALEDLYQAQILWHRAWAENFSSWQESSGRAPLESAEYYWPLRPLSS